MQRIYDCLIKQKELFLVLNSIAVLAIILWSSNRGLIFSDAAFYNFHFIDGLETIDTSNWHRIWRLFHTSNLVIDKIIIIIVSSLTSFFLGFTFSKVFLIGKPNFLGLLIFCSQFFLYAPVEFTPSYISLSSINFNLIFIFFLKYYANQRRIDALLTGFFLAMIPFIMITNSLFLVGAVLCIILLKMLNKTTVFIGLGFMIGLGIYFMLIQSVDDYVLGFSKALTYIQFDKSHGSGSIFYWIADIILELKWILILITIDFFQTKYFKNKYISFVIYFILTLLIIFSLNQSLRNSFYIFHTKVYYIIFLWIFYKSIQYLGKMDIILIILFISLPFFASIGTDVSFFVRASFYFPFTIISLIYLLKKNPNIIWKRSLLILFLISSINFFTYPFRGSWAGYKIVKQINTIKIANFGPKLLLDSIHLNRVNEVKPFIKGKQNVIPSSIIDWGVLLLNEANPPLVFFRINPYVLENIKHKELNNIILLENKMEEYDMKLMTEKLGLNEYDLILKETDNYRIYIYSKYLEKL